MSTHLHYMQHALRLGERGLGHTWPNPSVGAVVVRDGVIVGRGHTARGGRPHAETQALAEAGDRARGATLYVTLEPCTHHGQTPPCTDAIIAAGITHVVSACADPNPHVAGKGHALLRSAGITVTERVGEADAIETHAGFFSSVLKGRPLVSLKLATSLDGKIATRHGESQWITNELSRERGHLLRANHDAILTGISTILTDNPRLNCRVAGREQDSPTRIVLDTHLRIPLDAAIFPAWIVTSEGALKQEKGKVAELEALGCRLFSAPVQMEHLNLQSVVATLAQAGITRVLVEAGNRLNSHFLQEQLVHRLYWFRAPLIIGDGGLSGISHHTDILAEASRYRLRSVEALHDDILAIYDCAPIVASS